MKILLLFIRVYVFSIKALPLRVAEHYTSLIFIFYIFFFFFLIFLYSLFLKIGSYSVIYSVVFHFPKCLEPISESDFTCAPLPLLSTGVLNQSPFIRCRSPTGRTFALISVCVWVRNWEHGCVFKNLPWTVRKLFFGVFVHVVLSVVILSTGLCCVRERKLVPERFSGQKVFVVCFFFFPPSFPIRFVLRQWHLSFLLHSVRRLKCEVPCGELHQVRHLPCFLSCRACACGCHASTFNLLSQQLYKWNWKQSTTYTANDKALTEGMNEWMKQVHDSNVWIAIMGGGGGTWWLLIKQPRYAARSHYIP